MSSLGGNSAPTGRTATNGFNLLPATTAPATTASHHPFQRTKHVVSEGSGGTLHIGPHAVTTPKKFGSFDPKLMQAFLKKKGFAGIIYGRRGTGKTTLLKDFIYHNRKMWDKAYLFSQTAKMQPENYYWVPEHRIYDQYDDSALMSIIADQKKDVESKKKNDQDDAIENILIVFDDIISEEKIRHSAAFNMLFTLGRHYYITPIVLTQSVGGANGIPKVVRDNVDVVVGFFAHNQYDRELLVERYLSILHKKIGDEIYRNITSQPYTAIVAVVGEPNIRTYEDYVYSYRAPVKTPKFMIGKAISLSKREVSTLTDYTVKVPVTLPTGEIGALISFD